MLKIETRTALLSELQLNSDNPRTIKGEAFDNLVKSLWLAVIIFFLDKSTNNCTKVQKFVLFA